MKLRLPLKLAALATVAITSIIPFSPVKANTFNEEEVEQSQFIAVAEPFGDHQHNLLIIEQIPGKQACWSETGSNPVIVEPLLLNFDFTGHCRRATDSNGYSVRMDGIDYGLEYILRIVERDGELVLVGTNRLNTKEEVEIGRSGGLGSGFEKIMLNPGWRFTKRTYEGKTLGHIYFSHTSQQTGVETPAVSMPQE